MTSLFNTWLVSDFEEKLWLNQKRATLIPWRFLEYFRASKSTKINHMHSNHRHKIGFQDVVYSKLNKWGAKIFKNIDKKTSTWCVKLIRKQAIILFLYRATKCPTDAEKIEYAKMSIDYRGQNETKYNRISFLVLQSNLSNTDTEGTEQSVRIREVSVLERSRRLRHF